MKIEKINDNQIRCTLTRQDLENHQIRLSELAYGTDKAKQLFRDMMQQAQIQFGFEADNMPLMIEAVPVNTESIILIITKVEDPEELDTRFSKFSPYKDQKMQDSLSLDGADSILDLFQKLREARREDTGKKEENAIPSQEAIVSETADSSLQLTRLYVFRQLDDIIHVSKELSGMPLGENRLFRLHSGNEYQLVLHQGESSPEEFNKINNILSEYAVGKNLSSSGEAYFTEHAELISLNPLSLLAEL